VARALQVAGLESVDLIQIDAEGYDWPIIRSIDFDRVRPAIVRFEYRNMLPSDADACLAHLAAHGYRFLLEPRYYRPSHGQGPGRSVAGLGRVTFCRTALIERSPLGASADERYTRAGA
jgi:hypothetical protein